MRWPAPVASTPVDATVGVPGSKSVTNRALVLAALANGRSFLRQPLRSRDTELMAVALRSLGTGLDTTGEDWVVDGAPFVATDVVIDVGNAGTVARFLPPAAALAPAAVRMDGDPRIRERPLGPLIAALRDLGVRIEPADAHGLPLTVFGTGRVRGGAVTVDASASSQFVSGLLLAGAHYDDGLTVTHRGPSLPSAPHLAMTVDMLRAAGATVDDSQPDTWRVEPGGVRAHDWQVEPDLSSAAPFLAAAVATGGTVRVREWPGHTTQPGAALPGLLQAFGASTRIDDRVLVVTGPKRINGIDVDLHEVGELTPVVAALAALAASPSRLSGISHLRRHETDRLAALAAEINALGGDVEETEDGLAIRPRPLHGGVFTTYDDHRMAMAAAVIGLVTPGVVLDDVATTRKTLPDFATMWTEMLGAPGDPT